MESRTVLLAALLLSTCAYTRSAAAFGYAEHASITNQALQLLIARSPNSRDDIARLGRILRACDGPCSEYSFADEANPDGRFSFSDLPAIAGDHASSPMTLAKRWFEPGKRRSVRLIDQLGTALRNLGRSYLPPDGCDDGEGAPDRARFISCIRKAQAGLDVDLDQCEAEADSAYVCLAMHGRGHFRTVNAWPAAAAVQDLRRFPSAPAMYDFYHRAALRVAAVAHIAREKGSKASERLSALSWLLEAFSLHFLQDSVAAGHMTTDMRRLSEASAKATHDFFNKRGLLVHVPDALCQYQSDSFGEKPRQLAEVCQTSGSFRLACLLGDGMLDSTSCNVPEASAVPVITKDVAVLLAAASMNEVAAAAPAGDGNCHGAVVRCLEHDGTSGALGCLATLPEGICTDPARDGGGEARMPTILEALPLPAEPLDDVLVVSGSGLGLRTLNWFLPMFVDADGGSKTGQATATLWTIAVELVWILPPLRKVQLEFSFDQNITLPLPELSSSSGYVPSLYGLGGSVGIVWDPPLLPWGMEHRIGISVESLRRIDSSLADSFNVGFGFHLQPFAWRIAQSDDFALYLGGDLKAVVPWDFSEGTILVGWSLSGAWTGFFRGRQ